MTRISCLAIFFLVPFFCAAQDTHYGSHQFGTRSALLGGAVVGGTPDNSMIFYNPAAIAFIDSNSFSISANIYQAENTRIKNVLTELKDFSSLQLTSVPILTAGQFRTNSKKLRVSYGVFSPVAFQFRGVARLEGPYAVVPDAESPGLETFVGDELLFSRLRELNIAVGVSYKLSDNWSVGLTNMFNVRSHNYYRSVFTHYLLNNANNTLVSTALTQSFNYFNVRYLPKLGIAYNSTTFTWGATVTAPGVRMLGSGSAGIDITATNVTAGQNTRSTIAANNRETGLKSYYKSPVSVATGVQLKYGNTNIYVSGQYSSREKIYSILKGKETPFVQPQTAYSLVNGDALLQVQTAARPVLNIAVGMEHILNNRMSVLASIRNNQSYYDPALLNESGIKADITTWDIYHLVGGVTRRSERSSISLGLAFGYGADKQRSDQYLPLPSETTFFKSPITVTQATYSTLGVLIGYNYFFKKG